MPHSVINKIFEYLKYFWAKVIFHFCVQKSLKGFVINGAKTESLIKNSEYEEETFLLTVVL